MTNEELQKPFSIDAISREDLLNAGLDEALVFQLTDEDMTAIAEELAETVQVSINDAIAEIANDRQQQALDEEDEGCLHNFEDNICKTCGAVRE